MINNYNLEYLSQEIKDRLGYADNASYKLEQPLNSLNNAKNSSANEIKSQVKRNGKTFEIINGERRRVITAYLDKSPSPDSLPKGKVAKGDGNTLRPNDLDLIPSELKASGSAKPSKGENKLLSGEDASNSASLNSNAKNSSANAVKCQGLIHCLDLANSFLYNATHAFLREWLI